MRDALLPTTAFAGVICMMAVGHNFSIYREIRPLPSTLAEIGSAIIFTALAIYWYRKPPGILAAPLFMTGLLLLGQVCLFTEVLDWDDARQAAFFSLVAVTIGSLVVIPSWLAANLAINCLFWFVSMNMLVPAPNWSHYGMFQAFAVAIAVLVGSARIRTTLHLTEVRVRERRQRQELARAYDALALADDRFQSLLGAVDDIVWASSLNGRDLYFISPILETLSGIPLDRYFKKPGLWRDLVHPEDREWVEAWSETLLDMGHIEAEYRIVTKDGDIRWIQDRRRVITNDAGTPVRLGGISRDITDRKRTEVAIARNHERMTHTQKIARVGSWEWEPETNHVMWSEGMLDILGIDADTFSGTMDEALQFIHPEDRTLVAETARRTLETGEPYPIEYRGIRQDGKVRHLWAVGKAMRDESGAVVTVFGTVQDITARKRVEAERRDLESRLMQTQKQESLGALAGGIAHDFNNMLMGILGNVSVARLLGGDNGQLQTPLTHIERSAERAAHMSRQMLTYSGRNVLRRRPLDINDVVGAARADMERLAGPHIHVDYDLSPDLPACSVDEKELRQGILNLVLNAVEALDHSEGRVTLRTHRCELDESRLRSMPHATNSHPGEYVAIEIEDEGHGIAEELVPRLFDPFFTSKGMGRGLGLAMVLGIIRSHDGAIGVTSTPGQGASFCLYFPVLPQACPTGPTDTSEEGAPRECGRTVLVIDDEAALLESVSMMLEHLGHPSVTASGGRAGLDTYYDMKEAIGLVILDLTMPGLTGRDVLAALREDNPRLRVIMSSGYPEDCDTLLENDPALGFLQKPYRMRELQEVLRTTLGEHAAPLMDA